MQFLHNIFILCIAEASSKLKIEGQQFAWPLQLNSYVSKVDFGITYVIF